MIHSFDDMIVNGEKSRIGVTIGYHYSATTHCRTSFCRSISYRSWTTRPHHPFHASTLLASYPGKNNIQNVSTRPSVQHIHWFFATLHVISSHVMRFTSFTTVCARPRKVTSPAFDLDFSLETEHFLSRVQ